MFRIIRCCAVLFVFLCSLSLSAKSKNKLLITGSSTIAPLMLEVSKEFEKQNNNFQINIQTGGSSRGISDQRRDIADLGMVSRSLNKTEKDLEGFLLARDGISIIVHKTNPIKNLSRSQVIDIYRGRITNWKELGGKDLSIDVINKAEGRSTLEVFLNFFNLKNSQIKPSVIIGDNEQGIKTIAGNPQAIAYVSIGAAQVNEKLGVNIKRIKLEGVEASVSNIQNSKYPLARELNLVISPKNLLKSKEFIKFLRTAKVKKIVEQHYFIPAIQ